jgi:TolB-like protein/DNA-binding winged helix-turn-helix (wHTH) protein/Flp pilus assembly protein TadD
MPETTQTPTVRRFGAFEVNLQSGELRKNGMRLRLSGQPFQVLAVLVQRPGEVVTREELHSKLWPADTFVDFDHGLNNAVARIREVLDDSSTTPRYVETIPRRGYRFIAPVTEGRQTEVLPAEEDAISSPVREIIRRDASEQPWDFSKGRFSSGRLRVLLGGVAVLAVFAIGLVLYRDRTASSTRALAIRSLAVLPLKNLSGDPTQEYFADGMTEELIGRLSMIHGLRVISRTSAMHFKNTQLSMPEIAKALGVDAIVEGSVMREGGRIRVHTQLIRGATDEHFWSESYDRELQDVLALQSDVAQSVATKVEATISGEERERLTAVRSVSPEVYENYLNGEFGNTNTRADVEQSIAYYEHAITKDPTFAPAYVGLVIAYDHLGDLAVGVPPDEVRPKEISAAHKALELDPGLATPHAYIADLYQQQWQWAEAEVEYKRALELNPNDAAAHLGLANWLLCHGRTEEALTWSERARELDPLGVTGLSNGWILFNARRYNDAIRELRSVIAVHPDYATAHWFLGFALIASGQSDEAITALKKAALLNGRSPAVMGTLVRAYAQAGRRREAHTVLGELKQRQQEGYVPAAAFVDAYLGLAETDQAFAWLERAYQEHSIIMQLLKVDPLFDPLSSDPRFADLVRRVGLN